MITHTAIQTSTYIRNTAYVCVKVNCVPSALNSNSKKYILSVKKLLLLLQKMAYIKYSTFDVDTKTKPLSQCFTFEIQKNSSHSSLTL